MATKYLLAKKDHRYPFLDEYKLKDYARCTNLRKAIKRYKEERPYAEFMDIRLYRYTNGTYEYTIYLD